MPTRRARSPSSVTVCCRSCVSALPLRAEGRSRAGTRSQQRVRGPSRRTRAANRRVTVSARGCAAARSALRVPRDAFRVGVGLSRQVERRLKWSSSFPAAGAAPCVRRQRVPLGGPDRRSLQGLLGHDDHGAGSDVRQPHRDASGDCTGDDSEPASTTHDDACIAHFCGAGDLSGGVVVRRLDEEGGVDAFFSQLFDLSPQLRDTVELVCEHRAARPARLPWNRSSQWNAIREPPGFKSSTATLSAPSATDDASVAQKRGLVHGVPFRWGDCSEWCAARAARESENTLSVLREKPWCVATGLRTGGRLVERVAESVSSRMSRRPHRRTMATTKEER